MTSIAYDPQAGKAYYTTDNNAYRDLMDVDMPDGKTRMLIEDAAQGDIVLNPVDRSIWGVRHHNGLDTIVRIPLRTPNGSRCTCFRTAKSHSTWTSLPTARWCRLRWPVSIRAAPGPR